MLSPDRRRGGGRSSHSVAGSETIRQCSATLRSFSPRQTATEAPFLASLWRSLYFLDRLTSPQLDSGSVFRYVHMYVMCVDVLHCSLMGWLDAVSLLLSLSLCVVCTSRLGAVWGQWGRKLTCCQHTCTSCTLSTQRYTHTHTYHHTYLCVCIMSFAV